jgi:hypothetical protein
MSKIAIVVLVFCAVLATPVLGDGDWVYQGTTVYVSPPADLADPYGTWTCGWDGGGDAGGDAYNLWASGGTTGYATVTLDDYDGAGNRDAYAWSCVNARSDYQWSGGNNSKDIDLYVSGTIYDGWVSYGGSAYCSTDGTYYSSCVSATNADGGAGGTYAGDYYPGGYGWGIADSVGNLDGGNDPYDVDVYDDYFDSGYQPLYYGAYYEGSLGFTGTIETDGPLHYVGTENDNWFSAYTVIEGAAFAQGQLVANDPNPSSGEFSADAEYGIDADTNVDLYGNIR